jgi:hypothetical protein
VAMHRRAWRQQSRVGDLCACRQSLVAVVIASFEHLACTKVARAVAP